MILTKKAPIKKQRKIILYFTEWYEVAIGGNWFENKKTGLELIILAIEFEMYCVSRSFYPIWDG